MLIEDVSLLEEVREESTRSIIAVRKLLVPCEYFCHASIKGIRRYASLVSRASDRATLTRMSQVVGDLICQFIERIEADNLLVFPEKTQQLARSLVKHEATACWYLKGSRRRFVILPNSAINDSFHNSQVDAGRVQYLGVSGTGDSVALDGWNDAS